MRSHRLLTCVVCCLLAGACSEDDPSAGSGGETGTSGGAETETSESDTASAGVSYSGIVTDFSSASLLEGVSICVYEAPSIPCATSGASGEYLLPGVPPSTQTALVFTLDGYMPAIAWGTSPASDTELSANLFSDQYRADYAAALGVGLNDSRGLVEIGVRVSGISMSTNDQTGLGPNYLDDDLLPSADVQATRENGFGGWANVAPGPVEVWATRGDGSPCTPGPNATPGATANSAVLTVVAGFVASVNTSFDCG